MVLASMPQVPDLKYLTFQIAHDIMATTPRLRIFCLAVSELCRISYQLHWTPSLQHRRDTLSQNLFYPLDPPPELHLHALIVILHALANEWQHLRQLRQPFFSQPFRQRQLRLHSRKPDCGAVIAHVLQQGPAERFMLCWRVGGGGEEGYHGDQLRKQDGGVSGRRYRRKLGKEGGAEGREVGS